MPPAEDVESAFRSLAEDWARHDIDRDGLALGDFAGDLAQLRRLRRSEGLPGGRVPVGEPWMDDDGGRLVGCVSPGFRLTPALEVAAGHVGYGVRPSVRRRGCSRTAPRLALPEARRRGVRRILITTDSDDRPSARIVERDGGLPQREAVSRRTRRPILRYGIDTSP